MEALMTATPWVSSASWLVNVLPDKSGTFMVRKYSSLTTEHLALGTSSGDEGVCPSTVKFTVVYCTASGGKLIAPADSTPGKACIL
jgi:hypothetical protein